MAGKPAFDPNKAFEPVKKPEFNENKSFATIENVPSDAKQDVIFKPGAGMAALEGFGNSASQGYLAQLQAVTEPAIFKGLNLLTGQNVQPTESYVGRRDENLRRQAQQQQENPVAAGIGGLAGTIAGTTALSPLLPSVGLKGVGALGNIGRAALGGGAVAAIQNPGDVEGVLNPIQAGERSSNAGTGALIGGAAQGVLSGAGKALDIAKGLPDKLKNFADNKTFKSSGAMLKDFRKAYGQDKIGEIATIMRERGLIKPGSTFEDIAEAASKLKGEEGKKIGDFINKLDDFQKTVNYTDDVTRPIGAEFSTKAQLSDSVEKNLIKESSVPSIVKKNETFKTLSDEFKAKSGQNLTIKDLQNLKNDLKEQINFDRPYGSDIPIEEQFNRSLLNSVKKELESKAETLVKSTGLGEYVNSKKAYGVAKEIGKIAKDRVARENANRIFSPTDYLTSLGGLATGVAAGGDIEDKVKLGALGLTAGLANKGARLYGNPIVASLAAKTASILERNPNLLGEFARPLTDAAARGGSAFAATISKLATNPKFQESLAVEQSPNLQQNQRLPAQETAIMRRIQR